MGATCTIQKWRNSLKSSPLKPLVGFWNNFTDMFLGWPFSKIVREILIHQKTCGSGEWGFLCTIQKWRKFLKKSSSLKPLGQILTITWLECSLGGPLSKIVHRNFDSSKTLVAMATKWNLLKKFFKILLLWNRWSDFEIISQSCSLGDPFQKLFTKFWSVKKHGSGEWGLLGRSIWKWRNS